MTQSSVRAMPARLDVATLREWLDARDHDSREAPRVLDVRTAAEFRTVHIPGSYNVPLDLLREHRGELSRHLEQDVVLVCRSGARAGQAETLLADTGLPNVHVLDGGLLAWQRTGHGPDQAGLVIHDQRPQRGVGRGRRRWCQGDQLSSMAMNAPCQVWYQTAPLEELTDIIPLTAPLRWRSVVK
jgi:rhodanese-related sulfurtransferase